MTEHQWPNSLALEGVEVRAQAQSVPERRICTLAGALTDEHGQYEMTDLAQLLAVRPKLLQIYSMAYSKEQRPEQVTADCFGEAGLVP